MHKHATRAAYSTTSSSSGGAAGSRSSSGGSALKPPVKPVEGIPGFFNALGKVIRRDLGIDK